VTRRGEDESLPPIWARPEPPGRGPRAALSRSQIVQVALRIADEEGLEAVSMRRLARELGSGAMSLYHYFQSRDELLDLMGDTVAAEMLVPGEMPSDWREALTAIARSSRAAFQRHPWLLTTLQERPRVSPNLLRHVEQSSQSVAKLAEAGHDPDLLSGIVFAVDDYMIGYTLRELAAPDTEVRILSMFLARGGQPRRPDFDTGLKWLLDGFAAQLGL
jgi:AcrR family transcriptional regulator